MVVKSIHKNVPEILVGMYMVQELFSSVHWKKINFNVWVKRNSYFLVQIEILCSIYCLTLLVLRGFMAPSYWHWFSSGEISNGTHSSLADILHQNFWNFLSMINLKQPIDLVSIYLIFFQGSFQHHPCFVHITHNLLILITLNLIGG